MTGGSEGEFEPPRFHGVDQGDDFPDAFGGFLQLSVLECSAVETRFEFRLFVVERFQIPFDPFQFLLFLVGKLSFGRLPGFFRFSAGEAA